MSNLAKARTRLILDHPFFAQLLLTRPMTADASKTETMATDGKALWFNPVWVEQHSVAELQTILAHEVLHIAGEHGLRRGERDAQTWNIACDLAINPILAASGFAMPKDAMLDPRFKDATPEAIYQALQEDKSKDGRKKAPQPGQAGAQDPGKMGATLDTPNDQGEPMSPAEREQAKGELRVEVAQAAQLAKKRGKLPGELERFAADILQPKADWRAILASFVRDRASEDYSWTRPNRRFLGTGVILPSLYSEQMGEIVVAVDTSGSIDEALLGRFASELRSAVEQVNPSAVHVVYCDTAVRKVDTYERGADIVVSATGGGGTDFRPVFKHVAREGWNPACMVFFTDTYGAFPTEAPEYPVLWAVANKEAAAPWGELVSVE